MPKPLEAGRFFDQAPVARRLQKNANTPLVHPQEYRNVVLAILLDGGSRRMK
jgi:hypothetical protein